jgi:Protein of unknown function (DUF2550)
VGEHLALDIGEVLAAVVLGAVLIFLIMSARRWLFERGGGTVECSLRTLEADGGVGVWRLGIGRYRGDELHWHRIFGFRSRPRQVIHRRGLVISNRRRPTVSEEGALPPDAGIIEVRDGEITVELAMGVAALTGFLAWLEAAPPGFPVDVSSSSP